MLFFQSLVKAYIQWRNNMVLTTVNSVALPVEEVEFPAITICSQGMSLMFPSTLGNMVMDTLFFSLLCAYACAR